MSLDLHPGMRVLVRTDGTVQKLEGKQPLPKVYEHIGHGCDCIDVVNLRRHGLVMMVDDMGMFQQPEVNETATQLYWDVCIPGTTHQIRGNAVIVPDADFA